MSNIFTNRTLPISNKIDASVNNVPTGFSTVAGSMALTGITRAQGLIITNYTDSRLKVHYTHGSTATAPTGAPQGYVPPKGDAEFAASAKDNLLLSSTVFIASDTGSAVSSGVITLEAW